MKILKNISKLFLIIGFFINFMNLANAKQSEKAKVYVSQFAKHPALDATFSGIIDGLKDLGFNGSNLDIKVEYAQASPALAQSIAIKFVSKNPDIVIGIGTVSSQSFMKYVKDKKVKLVFSSVTDPLGANLVNNLNSSGEFVTGVSNYILLEPQLEMFKKINPNLRTLGFLYNPSEANSVSLIKNLQEICPKFGIKLVTQVASQTSEVMQATQKLASTVDAIFISNDSTALSAIQIIVKVAKDQKIPVFVSDTDIVKDGPLAAIGPNQYAIGKQTAGIVVRVLNGEDIGKIPTQFPAKTELYINLKTAKELGITISQELIKTADKILE